MYLVGRIELWIGLILGYALTALRLWALIDCLIRKPAAFTAAQKLSKPTWIGMLLLAGLLGSLPLFGGALGIFSLVSTVVAAVYLADVRPAVREISRGR